MLTVCQHLQITCNILLSSSSSLPSSLPPFLPCLSFSDSLCHTVGDQLTHTPWHTLYYVLFVSTSKTSHSIHHAKNFGTADLLRKTFKIIIYIWTFLHDCNHYKIHIKPCLGYTVQCHIFQMLLCCQLHW